MQKDWLESILILQDRDVRCDNIIKQISYIPEQIVREEAAIESEKQQLKEKEDELKALEIKHRDAEGEIAQLEESVVKYKTQQMEVKKNEEYTAFENEISGLQTKIDQLENDVIFLMEQQDSCKMEYSQLKEKVEIQVSSYEHHIEKLKEGEVNFKKELESAKEAVEKAKEAVDSSLLSEYSDVKAQINRPPYVVPLQESKCSGCHLKVSGEVESQARKRVSTIHCDSCGRILYFER